MPPKETSVMDDVRTKLAEIFSAADTEKGAPDGLLTPAEITTKLDLGACAFFLFLSPQKDNNLKSRVSLPARPCCTSEHCWCGR